MRLYPCSRAATGVAGAPAHATVPHARSPPHGRHPVVVVIPWPKDIHHDQTRALRVRLSQQADDVTRQTTQANMVAPSLT